MKKMLIMLAMLGALGCGGATDPAPNDCYEVGYDGPLLAAHCVDERIYAIYLKVELDPHFSGYRRTYYWSTRHPHPVRVFDTRINLEGESWLCLTPYAQRVHVKVPARRIISSRIFDYHPSACKDSLLNL